MKIITELQNREIVKEITNLDKLKKIKKSHGVYIGFDPTAISLHLGNYIQITVLKRFKDAGYNAIALLGGATGMIGDPSGRSNERKLQTPKQLLENKKSIEKQLKKFSFEVVDNYSHFKNMNIIDFLRDIGKLLNVNYMISKDSVKSRLNSGLSFTEFSYQLLQAWDFKKLYQDKNVRIQIGGSDQWGNITSGLEIIRKTHGEDNCAVGITTNLLTDYNGKKFGKSTVGDVLWLDKKLCSPYNLYQYLININDDDVEKLLKWITFLPLSKIDKIMAHHNKEPFNRIAQKSLAKEIVSDIHSKKDYDIAVKLSDTLFGNSLIEELKENDLEQLVDAIPTIKTKISDIQELLVMSGVGTSKRQVREFILNGAININGTKIDKIDAKIPKLFNNKFLLIRRGKKKWFLVKR